MLVGDNRVISLGNQLGGENKADIATEIEKNKKESASDDGSITELLKYGL